MGVIHKNQDLGIVDHVTGTFVLDHSFTKMSYIELRQNLGSSAFYDLAPMSPDAAVDYLRKIKTVSQPKNKLLF